MATSSGLRGDAARLKEILSILRQRGATRGLTPEKLRLVLEDLGPTFMKIGQLLSLRSDMIPREYCQELAKLRTEAAPMPLTEVRAAVENELGAPLTELFSTFDEAPLGSASIAQAHRATLKSGESVVVKVQRPGIYETMEQDIALLRRAAGLLKLAAGTAKPSIFPWCWTSFGRFHSRRWIFCGKPPTRKNFTSATRAWPLLPARRFTARSPRGMC